MKLVTGGAKRLLLDLTAATALDEGARSELARLRVVAVEAGGLVAVASAIDGFGDAPEVEAALRELASPLFFARSEEAALVFRLRALEKRREALSEALKGREADGTTAVRRENSELSRRVAELEAQLEALLREEPPARPEPLDEMSRSVGKVALEVLQGVKLGAEPGAQGSGARGPA
jgi:hypothetical protein